jgi:hypothetical protein
LRRGAQECLPASEAVSQRAGELRDAGYGFFDALHLAFAEAACVDALLTRDDRFARTAGNGVWLAPRPSRQPCTKDTGAFEMTSVTDMTDEQFEAALFDLIEREFGLAGLGRYMRLHPIPCSDYTRDRHQWLGDQTFDVDDSEP